MLQRSSTYFQSTEIRIYFLILGICTSVLLLSAQDLDPRAYIRLPVRTNSLITGYNLSVGSVVTDPTLPFEDMDATVHSVSFGYVRSFNFFGLTSQAMVALPYSWADVSGLVTGQEQAVSRSGPADSRARFTVLLLGAPAAELDEFLKSKQKTILGVSLNVGAPTGQFYSDKLINIGTNRWSVKPEIALSHPIGKRWLVDVYSGVWFFTTNNSFYPGSSEREQKPMGAFQAHISYNITPRFWIAYNATYYVGGESSINGAYSDDRQNNTRIGLTAVMPVGKSNSIKLAASTGAVIRIGPDFTNFSIGWQHAWIGPSSKKNNQ